MDSFMQAQNNVRSFTRDEHKVTDDHREEMLSYGQYATARALAAAIYEAGLLPEDLMIAMQDHLKDIEA
ncbi:hypothetical protein [uncultured phage MedDCM-OCT-S08-C41]|uniref:Uncharacterized protein n=1 Tax=uncultured phage MedDCM-OCT-S08-C41 TaxID=743578 RepID=D6PIF6_9CAUD|nr:hypothetical protein HOT88_gp31 [uncultured phage MedDCM-OCT-S08-C41]ADD95507.1 hypothetical protein [uncultured phage MedDCM-OCT-S08-C41]